MYQVRLNLCQQSALLFLAIGLFSSCKSINSEKIKFDQYMVAGEKLYQSNCQNCHASDGTGLGRLIPPLANNFILQNKKKSICGIKFGWRGALVVDGTTYEGQMPANKRLTNLEIAEIITFVTNSWGQQSGITLAIEVERAIAKCTEK